MVRIKYTYYITCIALNRAYYIFQHYSLHSSVFGVGEGLKGRREGLNADFSAISRSPAILSRLFCFRYIY